VKKRIGGSTLSAAIAAVFMGLFAGRPMAFGSVGYWLFVVAVFALAFTFYGHVD
jgi:hypothetical protein